MIKLGIVEDDPFIRKSFIDYLNSCEEFECVNEAESVEAFFIKIEKTGVPDIVLMDIGLPGVSGIEGTIKLKARYKNTEVIMITVYQDSERIFKSLCAGALGYLHKNIPLYKLKDAILDVKAGGSPLTPSIARKVIGHFNNIGAANKAILSNREGEVVTLIVKGLSYKMIAAQLNISINTVRGHIKRIYKKLEINCKSELISKSFRGEI